MIIPEAVFHARAVKFGSVGGLDTFVKISSGFCDNKKSIFDEYLVHFVALGA